MIKANIVADSISVSQARITTFVLVYPRFIHAELMTHRVFSRNASSSRAIPVSKQIQDVIDNPAIPLAFRKNKKGMQAGELLADQQAAVDLWLEARNAAVVQAKAMADMDIHKQYANRILEPFAHISVVLTGTDFENFFALRVHPDAQPEICELATQMYIAYCQNQPNFLENGEWHVPFITVEDLNECFVEVDKLGGGRSWAETVAIVKDLSIKRSVAKCARVSYNNHDGSNSTIAQDLSLYERLLGSVPIHASPAEHQAMAVPQADIQSGNLRGFIQYRKTLTNECVNKFHLHKDEEE